MAKPKSDSLLVSSLPLDNQRVIRSAGLVSGFISLSRLCGLVRDMAMAAFFGSSMAMDAFVVAFTIPNLFRNLFGEGALSSAFVPVFTETFEKQGRDTVWRFAANMMSLLSLVLAALVLAGIGVTAGLLAVFPFSARMALILSLLQIMLPYMFFICLAAFFSAMLNTLHRFALPAAMPVVFNLIMIATLFLVCPRLDAEGRLQIVVVAWSVVAGGAVQWLMQLPLLMQNGFRLRLSFDWSDPRVRRVIQLMGVAVIGTGMTQISVLLDRLVAVFIGPGSASYLYYADRLNYLPLGLFATALGTVLLPVFSKHAAQERPDRIRETLNQAMRQLTFVMMPAAVGLLALARPIVALIFQRGNFTPETTAFTTVAVQCYAPGLLVFSLLKVLIPMFYAHQDMKTPVRVGVACTGLNIVLKLILVLAWWLWPFAYAYAGLAVGTVLSSAVAVVTLAILAQRRLGSCGWGSMALAGVRMLAAALVMSAVAVSAHRYLQDAEFPAYVPAFGRQLIAVLGAIGASVTTYLLAAALFGCRELAEFRDAIRRRRTI